MRKPVKSYRDPAFINSRAARAVRILAEYLQPKHQLEKFGIEDTVVFFGSARIRSKSPYYKAARELAFRITSWRQKLKKGKQRGERRFVVCTGGGPGIMEAANRGAADAGGVSVGLSIALPHEQGGNRYVTPDLAIHFHYFFMRKFWLAYSAKAVVVFPGGFGTLDELFEILTLVQTRRMTKPMPIVLFGAAYWNEVIDFGALARHGTIDEADLKLFHLTDSVDDAYRWITKRLAAHSLDKPGVRL